MRFNTFLSVATVMTALCWAGTTAIAGVPATQKATAPTTAEIGKPAPAFTLMDLEGKPVSLSDFKGKTVVIEWFCPTCPFSGSSSARSIHSTGRVKTLLKNMKEVDPDAVYLLIDSSTKKLRISPEELTKRDAKAAEKLGITAPILIDADTSVAKAYGARTTPHVFVIDGEGVLRYQGAFDDRTAEGTNYPLNAVKAIKAGTKVEPTYVRQWGCGVKTG
ncbi:MAG: redoxin domain-containing protein [Planctomycetota bacterium]|nr:redoxin domain-containing protein [Planctomycetota bacterium]